jgi:NADH:ubiquinone oxidoreductase subunit K
MNPDALSLYGLFTVLLLVTGLYCVVATRNLIRLLIGLEILTKGVTLLIVLAGHLSGHYALGQALAITLIVIEVVVIAVAAGVAIAIYRRNGSLDTNLLKNLKG